ncbi:hypothetical protein N7448_009398 [Penicillium atrosanguineum]|uniref:Uncharacterized protein n=1 Tax=Penicillium atrosanguineum TaxID=1132637 RepID=A0A9W9U5T4_9EURO|nr:hypothetical protein N7448_009398 [Penicillium atrosanguineum]KAJ5321206.1 hypothetical protein N7476_004208 [Penicillium atrosanguineum]
MSSNTEPLSDYPPYTPMSSLGRELGITFAFIGACLITIAIYSVFWRAQQRRNADEDLARRRVFHSRLAPDDLPLGTTASVTTGNSDRGRVREKMLNGLLLPEERLKGSRGPAGMAELL